MGAVPKRKPSKGRKKRRRSHDALKATKTVKCPHCGEYKLPHRECPECGEYKSTQNPKSEIRSSKQILSTKS